MVIEEDKKHLHLQRQGRKRYMGRIDKELAEREQQKEERREAEERRILREKRCKSDSGEAQAGALAESEERNDGMNNISPDFLPKPRRQ